jgi:PAS domain S-box-containing protein
MLRAIVESLPFRVYACDTAGRCILQNPVSIRDFGHFLGRLPSELPLPEENIRNWQDSMARALAGEVVWKEQAVPIGGEIRHYRYVVAPIRDGDMIRGTVGVDIDITDLRRAEQALADAETRQRDAFERLRNRESELAHADRLHTMGYMASEMAHELNQPLYAIANFADACLALIDRQSGDRPVPPGGELRRWIEQIAQQARRAGNVLKRISQFARKGEFNRKPLDLNRTIQDVVAMLDFELRRHGIEVRLELAPQMPSVPGDQLLLEQVLVNLIRNAQQAMEKRTTRQLTIRSFAPNGKVGASVTDTGPGLMPEQFDKLFEPYYTTRAGGSGMGLAICRATIEAHDGEIWAYNEPEGGATFQFVLPAK